MPLKPQDTDKLNTTPADVPGKTDKKKQKQDKETSRDVRVGYGSARDAELNTAAEETERAEYDADGLQRTTKYSVNKR